jgi:hypothetical protein
MPATGVAGRAEMGSRTYSEAIRRAFQGETIGERLFRRLAERSDSAERSAKLHAIADVEALTRGKLEPIAIRLGVQQLSESEMTATIERREQQLAQLSWPDFIRTALTDWPPYIAEFEGMARLAPQGDESALRVLVEHERALVEFVRQEHANNGGGRSLQLLQQLLTDHGR